MKIRKKTAIPLLILIMMLLSELFMYQIEALKYYDEIFSIFFFIIIVCKSVKGGIAKVEREILCCCILLLFLGMIENLVSNMQNQWPALLQDIVRMFKLPICCIGYDCLLDRTVSRDIINYSSKIARVFIMCGAVCGVVSLFFDIGMRGQKRFGIWGFNYIFHYAHIYAMFLLFCMLFVCVTAKSMKEFWKYIIMVILQLILSTKGTSIVSAAAIPIIYFAMKNKTKIKLRTVIPLIAVGVVLGTYQIQAYLTNVNAPRYILFYYAFKTAARFFPLGAGFATYGSDIAANYYSKLHKDYGFYSYWGMRPGELYFLNDNYWPMVLGQFGVVGVVLVTIAIYKVFSVIQREKMDYHIKSLLISCLFYILLASLGTTIFTTSSTIILMFGMLIVLKGYNNNEICRKTE